MYARLGELFPGITRKTTISKERATAFCLTTGASRAGAPLG